MENIIKDMAVLAGSIEGVYTENIVLNESFLDMAGRFAHLPGTVLLMSGGKLDCARYHILGIDPWMTLLGYGRNLNLTIGRKTFSANGDPFECLKNILQVFKIESFVHAAPIQAGLMGYFSYDLKDQIEKLPRTSVDTLNLPHILLYAPSLLVVYDKSEQSCRLFIPKRRFPENQPVIKNGVRKKLENFKRVLAAKSRDSGTFSGNGEKLCSNLAKPEYIKAVKKIIEYIKAGDVYQVNMSQRFEMPFSGNSFSLFTHLFEKNPAPFFAYVNAGNHQIVSTSPERFILMDKKRVETRPIKGTRPRGKNSDEDDKFREELLSSRKDDAELSMIVDLLRNDIGKVCQPGSVHVTEHKRLEAYQNVYHLISIVEGTLEDSYDAVDLICAAFPGGSITGCPKIRSMEIIDELEPCRRHVYTGSIGYISFHDTMDLSIAIRTATSCRGRLYFSVGGGIVYDSDPEDEFEETLHKGRTLMDIFSGRPKIKEKSPVVWVNGGLCSADAARVSLEDEGFVYGFGFFETIRVVKGTPRFLERHTERFNKAWNEFFPDNPPDLTWEDIISQVLEANRFENEICSVKILATRGLGDFPAQNRTLLVTARPYVHRLAGKRATGLKVLTYPEPRQSPLADHKTMNYMYYLLAGRWAAEQGADESMVLNPDGTVSETNTANILLLKEKVVIIPESLHVLSGIFQEAVIELMEARGYACRYQKVYPRDIFKADRVILTNSLMGAVSVISLDGQPIGESNGLCNEINQALL